MRILRIFFLFLLLTAIPCQSVEAITDSDLILEDATLIQVVENPKVLVANKHFSIEVRISSTFRERVYANIEVTYGYGENTYLEVGPRSLGVPIEPGINTVYVPGGRASPSYSDPWIAGGAPPFLDYTRPGYDSGIKVKVDPSNRVLEASEANNEISCQAIEVRDSRELRVLWVPVAFPGEPDFTVSDYFRDTMYQYMLDLYPISRSNLIFEEVACRRCEESPVYTSGIRIDRDWLYEHVAAPLSLEARVLGYDRVIICLQEPFGAAGIAIGMMRDPVDQTPIIVHQRLDPEYIKETLVAHEVGHTLWLWHPHDFGPYVFTSTRYSSRTREYGERQPTFMSYRRTPMWIDDGRYQNDTRTPIPAGLYDFLGDPEGWADPYSQEVPGDLMNWNLVDQLTGSIFQVDAILASGTLYRNGTSRFSDTMFMLKASPSLPQNKDEQQKNTKYFIGLLDSEKKTVASYGFNAEFNYLVHDDFNVTFTLVETNAIPFSFIIPYEQGIKQVQIGDSGGKILASKVFSPNNPELRITSPRNEQVIPSGGGVTIKWSSEDKDGDTIRHIVTYSDNNGKTWNPLAFNIKDGSYEWDTSKLEDKDYLIKVIASDGLNTVEKSVKISLKSDAQPTIPAFRVGEPVKMNTEISNPSQATIVESDFEIYMISKGGTKYYAGRTKSNETVEQGKNIIIETFWDSSNAPPSYYDIEMKGEVKFTSGSTNVINSYVEDSFCLYEPITGLFNVPKPMTEANISSLFLPSDTYVQDGPIIIGLIIDNRGNTVFIPEIRLTLTGREGVKYTLPAQSYPWDPCEPGLNTYYYYTGLPDEVEPGWYQWRLDCYSYGCKTQIFSSITDLDDFWLKYYQLPDSKNKPGFYDWPRWLKDTGVWQWDDVSAAYMEWNKIDPSKIPTNWLHFTEKNDAWPNIVDSYASTQDIKVMQTDMQYEIQDVTYPNPVTQKDEMDIKITLRNTGNVPGVPTFDISVRSQDSGEEYKLESYEGSFCGEGETEYSIRLQLPEAAKPGSYNVHIDSVIEQAYPLRPEEWLQPANDASQLEMTELLLAIIQMYPGVEHLEGLQDESAFMSPGISEEKLHTLLGEASQEYNLPEYRFSWVSMESLKITETKESGSKETVGTDEETSPGLPISIPGYPWESILLSLLIGTYVLHHIQTRFERAQHIRS